MPAARRRVRPGAPRRLGHVNCLSSRFADAIRFYTEVLGMRITDRLGDGGDLVQRQHRPSRDGADRQAAGALPPLRLRHGRHRPDARPARPPRPPRPLARLGARPVTASAATSRATCGSSRRSASSSCTATWSSSRPTMSRGSGRTTATRRTPGARCRRARTSASTRRGRVGAREQGDCRASRSRRRPAR